MTHCASAWTAKDGKIPVDQTKLHKVPELKSGQRIQAPRYEWKDVGNSHVVAWSPRLIFLGGNPQPIASRRSNRQYPARVAGRPQDPAYLRG